MEKITVFTPCFNAAKTINRVYDSLLQQTYNNFEWIIVNDGSIDNSLDMIKEFKAEGKLDIKIINQENSGKHIALNKALDAATGYFFITIDADDGIFPWGLGLFISMWNLIPANERENFCGMKAKSCDNDTNVYRGKNFGNKAWLDTDLISFRFKMKLDNWEMSQMLRTDIYRQYKSPEIKGKFFPEIICQYEMAKKYKIRFIDYPTRMYYINEPSLTHSNYNKSKENIYLWTYLVNNFDYLPNLNFKLFTKAIIGMMRDTMYNNKKSGFDFKCIKLKRKRFYAYLIYPVAFWLYKNGK